MCSDIRQLRHRMAHQTTDASISVGKRMDVVEAVMGGGHGHDAACLFERCEIIPLFKILHEIRHTTARWRNVAAYGYVVFVAGAQAPGSIRNSRWGRG